MSKRTERRAAERAAHKANRTTTPAQNPTLAQAAVQQPAAQPAEAAAETFFTATASSDPECTTASALDEIHNAFNESLKSTQTSEAQINANRENAKKSTGPTTPEGKAKVSENRRTHGLLGRFKLLPFEDIREYFDLVESVHEEFSPQTDDEFRLANAMIQHHWLIQRALNLQEDTLMASYFPDHACEASSNPLTGNQQLDQKKLSLFMRYQAQHERSYAKARKELKTVQAERAKKQNGFESQTAKQAANEAKTRLDIARAEAIEIESECKKMMEGLVPGATEIGFEQFTRACADAMARLVHKNQSKTAGSEAE